MKLIVKKISTILLVVVVANLSIFANDSIPKERQYTSKGDNAVCFKCHGGYSYTMRNPVDSNQIARRKMYADLVIDSNAYYQSNHYDFKCTDCHSADYAQVPHKGELRFGEMPKCMDCHGGDEAYKKYNFENIEKEYNKSVHATKHTDEFSCWKCHDPHTYKINARNKTQDVSKTVAYDNGICLSCHANVEKYQFILGKENPDILTKHEWLPNQLSHFKSVRCIECHAMQSDSTLVAHNIQSKDKAVKKCVECHSGNSQLLQKLYSHQTTEKHEKEGFFSGVVLNDSRIIGATRNPTLNLISIVLFCCTVFGLLIHAILRIFIKKK